MSNEIGRTLNSESPVSWKRRCESRIEGINNLGDYTLTLRTSAGWKSARAANKGVERELGATKTWRELLTVIGSFDAGWRLHGQTAFTTFTVKRPSEYEFVKKLEIEGELVFYNTKTGLYEYFVETTERGPAVLSHDWKRCAYVRDYGTTLAEIEKIEEHVGLKFTDRIGASVMESLTEYRYIRNPENDVILECADNVEGRVTSGNITFDEVKRDIEYRHDTAGIFGYIGRRKVDILRELDINRLISQWVHGANRYYGDY